ncbi:MAG: metal ABC transporter substrate-binding protein [Gemmatimonadales bacterium]
MKQPTTCMFRAALAAAILAVIAAVPNQLAAQKKVRVVTSLSTYAAITREIVGDRGEVTSIGDGAENPHFVQPKPSFALRLKRADLLITTGLDLELWMPALLDRANNAKIKSGSQGFVTAYTGVDLLDIPASVNRSQGDIHLFGNPHIWTSPANAVIIGNNILTGLKRVSPENAEYFESRYSAWKEKVMRAYVGSALVDLLGVDVIFDLARKNQLWSFLNKQKYQNKPLVTRVGGWLAQAKPFRGQRMVCYHKEWDYFSRAFQVPCVEYVEPKPGIPPTPKHVAAVITLMKTEHIPVLFSTNYYDRGQVQSVASRTGAKAVIVPSNAGGAPHTDTYLDLVNLWIAQLAAAFGDQ